MTFMAFKQESRCNLSFAFNISNLLIFLSLTIRFSNCDDYYKLLEVEKDADNRAIRKSFKRLVLLHHPDKNQVTFCRKSHL